VIRGGLTSSSAGIAAAVDRPLITRNPSSGSGSRSLFDVTVGPGVMRQRESFQPFLAECKMNAVRPGATLHRSSHLPACNNESQAEQALHMKSARREARVPSRDLKLTPVSADALPGLAATEHSAEGATLNLEDVRTLHRDRGVVIAAATGIMDPADPLAVFRLHVDEDSFAGFLGIAAEIRAAFLNADIALVLFGGP